MRKVACIIAICLGASFWSVSYSASVEVKGFEDAISPESPTILYVNGIRNEFAKAQESSQALIDTMREMGIPQGKYNHEFFWNKKDGFWGVLDIEEVLLQARLSDEFWENPVGLGQRYRDMYTYVPKTDKVAYRVAQTTGLLRDRIKSILAVSTKVIVVPHSQGNMYVEAALAMILADPASAALLDRVKVVGVASAAGATLNNRYITHKNDYVVGEISDLAIATKVLKNYATLPSNATACRKGRCGDQIWWGNNNGHDFIDVYLNPEYTYEGSTDSFARIIFDHIAASLAEAEPQLIFFDAFDGTSLDTTKWTVERVGNAGTLTVAGGYLTADVPGGSCGRCGSGDGVRLRPIVSLPTGDFEFIVSGEELLRVANDSSGAKSEVSLGMFAGGVTQLGIGITGDFLNNSRRVGHGVYLYYQIGNVGTVALERSLPLGQYTNFTFRIRRVGSAVDMAFKVADDVNWTVFTVPAAFPAASLLPPVITIGAGDSGGTVINSRFKARLDFASLTGS